MRREYVIPMVLMVFMLGAMILALVTEYVPGKWELAVQALSALAALGSGFYWMVSAFTDIPWPDYKASADIGGLPRNTVEALQRQSNSNSTAALLAAFAAIAQAASIFFHIKSW